ncbi:hypothetical protein GCM10017771_10790 [Streptomyces capitiformicae]|uniref:Uncharacterized protein n=1 Tax=Streptomyces capitiformicae TaxID=2014920 RepID=A0A919L4N2_9ACTN|nr:hypothetical protein GCM10017771_10790 [Streptomyces capitiformicae]
MSEFGETVEVPFHDDAETAPLQFTYDIRFTYDIHVVSLHLRRARVVRLSA